MGIRDMREARYSSTPWDRSTPKLEVEPTPNKPRVALYGPKGEPLRYYPQRKTGYRRLEDED